MRKSKNQRRRVMNVDEVLKNIKNRLCTTTESKVLSDEVIRLREQRRQLTRELPLFKQLQKKTLYILDEVDIEEQKEEKKMTIDEALECAKSQPSETLAREVKRLREFNNEQVSIIMEKNEEIEHLQEEYRIQDQMIGGLRASLDDITRKLDKIRAMW